MRQYAWRSFFYAVRALAGEPRAHGEISAVRVVRRADLPALLTAPYHDSFRQWLQVGGTWFRSEWAD